MEQINTIRKKSMDLNKPLIILTKNNSKTLFVIEKDDVCYVPVFSISKSAQKYASKWYAQHILGYSLIGDKNQLMKIIDLIRNNYKKVMLMVNPINIDPHDCLVVDPNQQMDDNDYHPHNNRDI